METTQTGRKAKKAGGKLAKGSSEPSASTEDRVIWSDRMRKVLIDLYIEGKDTNDFTDNGLKSQQCTAVKQPSK